jgi:hypothetical protein
MRALQVFLLSQTLSHEVVKLARFGSFTDLGDHLETKIFE